MRSLVTGASGFVGRYLVELLATKGHQVYGTSLSQPPPAQSKAVEILGCDIRNLDHVSDVIRQVKPNNIFHLAAESSVRKSFQDFRMVHDTNYWGTFNILEAARLQAPQAQVLVVSSGQCYAPANRNQLPITESHPLSPQSPYSLTKACADMLSFYYQRYFGLHVVRARPFNHTGPGQPSELVCSDFARQIACIDLGLCPAEIVVGNLKVERDFLDVRDVVLAYEALLDRGRPGEAYNVASGTPTAITEILNTLLKLCSPRVRVIVDRKRFRPGESIVVYGSSRKLRSHTGWKPKIALRTTLRDLFSYWKEYISDDLGRTSPSRRADFGGRSSSAVRLLSVSRPECK